MRNEAQSKKRKETKMKYIQLGLAPKKVAEVYSFRIGFLLGG